MQLKLSFLSLFNKNKKSQIIRRDFVWTGSEIAQLFPCQIAIKFQIEFLHKKVLGVKKGSCFCVFHISKLNVIRAAKFDMEQNRTQIVT